MFIISIFYFQALTTTLPVSVVLLLYKDTTPRELSRQRTTPTPYSQMGVLLTHSKAWNSESLNSYNT
jgi:hypothetical protein